MEEVALTGGSSRHFTRIFTSKGKTQVQPGGVPGEGACPLSSKVNSALPLPIIFSAEKQHNGYFQKQKFTL